MKKIVLTCSFILAGISLIAQDQALKLNPVKNTVYRFKSTSDQNISQTINGMEQTTNASTNIVVSLKMLESTPEFLVMEARIDTMITRTNAMGKVTLISSANEGNMASEEAADVMSAVMNRLSKNALFVKMNITGEVIDIVNFGMLSEMIIRDTALIKGQNAEILKTQVINTVSRDAMKEIIESITHNLPGNTVKQGDKWDVSSPVNSGGMDLVVATSFVLDRFEGGNAIVSAESSIKAADNAKPMKYGGAEINYGNLIGMGKSQMTLDPATGLPKITSGKTHITGDLNISVQGMSLQMPMIIDAESETKAL